MTNFIQKSISIPKALLLIFTFVIGFSFSSQAELLTENPNPSEQASEEFAADSVYAILLWNQFDPTVGPAVASQRFPDFGNSVLQSADDFEVPTGETWSIEAVMTRGAFFNGNPDNGPIPFVNVIFYENNSGMPGNVIGACDYPSLAPADTADPNISVSLSTPCVLEEGHYWVSVMALMPFTPNGQWSWSTVDFTTLNEWQFQDPDSLVGNPCTTWGAGEADCSIGGSTVLDLQFQLFGELLGSIILNPITPAIKNNINSMSVADATPEGKVAFIWGFQTGSLILGGPVCNGLELGIKPAKLLGMMDAELDGTAEFLFYIPSLGNTAVVYTQAIDVDSCTVSEVIENILNID